ncbi:MAG: hypothetical protein DMD65_09070, partial [Gemmatimonadetes bacterium]
MRLEKAWRLPQTVGPGTTQARRGPLVGRAAELERLVDAWTACRRERRATVAVVEGDAGMGKTRLAEELVARARLDGAVVAAVRAVEADRSDAWSGVFGLARGGLLDAPGVAAAPPPALTQLRGGPPAAPAAAPGRALSDVLQAVADEQPRVPACARRGGPRSRAGAGALPADCGRAAASGRAGRAAGAHRARAGRHGGAARPARPRRPAHAGTLGAARVRRRGARSHHAPRGYRLGRHPAARGRAAARRGIGTRPARDRGRLAGAVAHPRPDAAGGPTGRDRGGDPDRVPATLAGRAARPRRRRGAERPRARTDPGAAGRPRRRGARHRPGRARVAAVAHRGA